MNTNYDVITVWGAALQAVLRQLVRQEEEARFCWLNNMVF